MKVMHVCSTSLPGGNQFNGLPPASSLSGEAYLCEKVWGLGRQMRMFLGLLRPK